MDGNQAEYTASFNAFDVQTVHHFPMQYVFMCLEIDLYLGMCFMLLCLGIWLASKRTNDKMQSAVLIKIIYQKVCWTIKSHLECNKGKHNTFMYVPPTHVHEWARSHTQNQTKTETKWKQYGIALRFITPHIYAHIWQFIHPQIWFKNT